MDNNRFINILKDKSLKITPQRIQVLRAIYISKDHPTAENIIKYIKKFNPSISTGTIYKVLDTLVKYGVIKKVETYNNIMRYEFPNKNHHHIYYSDKNILVDYHDLKLDLILSNYFKKKKIPNLEIENIKVHIIGRKNK